LDRFSNVFKSADNQCGFKKGIGCNYAIYNARKIVDKFISLGCTANLCAIDLSKAFDKVNHLALLIKLMKRHIPNELLELFENWFTNCHSCIKWFDAWSEMFRVSFGVRQGSVLSPFLFAIYLDDLAVNCQLHNGTFILLYADDILLLAPSVTTLKKLLHACENELCWLDMIINTKKVLLFTYRPMLSCQLCQHYNLVWSLSAVD